MSKDYRPSKASNNFEKELIAGGWFVFSHKKLETSPADIWSLILVSNDRKFTPSFINISPKNLLEKLIKTHGEKNQYHLYPWLFQSKFCLDGRGMKKSDKDNLLDDRVEIGSRNLSSYYDNWSFFNVLRN